MNNIDATLTNEQKMHVALLQKNSIKTKNIQRKLNKLQVFYEFKKQKNNELMF